MTLSFSINDLIKGSEEMSGYLWMCFVRCVKLGGEPTKLIRTISGKLTKVNNVKRHFFLASCLFEEPSDNLM